MKDKDKIESILQGQGFPDFTWIDPQSIVVAHWVRLKYTFGCADYGIATCPPNTPSVQDCEMNNQKRSGAQCPFCKI